jgi:hypothetical protein
MTMRITNPTALASLARNGSFRRRPDDAQRRSLRQRVNAYTLWAFNPQRELTSRHDRAA